MLVKHVQFTAHCYGNVSVLLQLLQPFYGPLSRTTRVSRYVFWLSLFVYWLSLVVLVSMIASSCLQCFDTVGWASGRTSGL